MSEKVIAASDTGGPVPPSEGHSRQPKSQMDAMNREELLLHAKKQLVLLQKVKSRCDEIGSRNATLEADLRSKESELTEIMTKYEANVTENIEIQQIFSIINEEKTSLTRKVSALEEQLECTQMKHETAEDTFSCLRDDVTELQAKNKELRNEVSVLKTAREDAVSSLKALKETLNEKHASEMSDLSQKMQEMESVNEQLENDVRSLRDELSACKQETATVLARLVESKEEKEQLQLNLIEFESISFEMDEVKVENGALEVEMSLLRERCEQLRQEVKEFAVKDESWQVERLEFANLKAEKESVESELKKLKLKDEESENALEMSRIECERLRKEVSEVLAQKSTRIERENEAKNAEIQELKAREVTSKLREVEYDTMRTRLESCEEKYRQSKEEMDVVVRENETLQLQLSESEVTTTWMNEEQSDIRQEALSSLRNEYDTLKIDFEELSVTRNVLRREKEELLEELKDTREQLLASQAEVSKERDCRTTVLSKEREELMSTQALLEAESAALLSSQRDCDSLRHEVEDLRSREGALQLLQQECDCLRQELDDLQCRESALKMMFDTVSKVERENVSLNDTLKFLIETVNHLDAKVTSLEDVETVETIGACCQTEVERPTDLTDVDIQVDISKVELQDVSTDCDFTSAERNTVERQTLDQSPNDHLQGKVTQFTASLRMMKNEIVSIVSKLKEVVKLLKDLEQEDVSSIGTLEDLEKWILDADRTKDDDVDRGDAMIGDLQKISNVIALLPSVLRKKHSSEPVGKESALKQAEDMVSKYKIIAVKAKKESAEIKKKLDTLNSELSASIREKISLEESVRSVGSQLNEERQKHKTTMSKLEQHSNLISLEIADYERHASDLSKQLADKDELKRTLEKDVAAQSERIHGLQVQIGQLENQYKQSEERGEQLKSVSVKLRKDIADLQKEEAEWKVREGSLLAQLESTSQEVENYKIQLSDVTALGQKLQSTNHSMQEAHQKVVRLLETRIGSLTEEIGKIRSEYENCLAEYESYKVRVHSVLKQQKSKSPAETVSGYELSAEEKVLMEKTIDALHTKILELSAQHAAVQTENETLQEEHFSLLQRHNKLAASLAEQESTWRQRLEKLQSELRLEQQEHSELMRHIQLQDEMHGLALKKTVDALNEVHQMEVERLQEQLGVIEAQNLKLQREVAQGEMTRHAYKDEEQLVDILNMERQEGEGSEFTDSQKLGLSSSITSFMPLEQLLSQDERTSISSINTIEIETLESQLTISTKKIEHLTEILHESEATNARMSEQNRVLKEEIRRLERNQEREKHLANMEYLKNVIVKFISLNAGDDRERLVPVLTTLLRLSPLEEQQVTAIAKGVVEVATNSAAGWSSYLPLPRWPGAS